MFIFEKNPKNLQKPVEYSPTDGTISKMCKLFSNLVKCCQICKFTSEISGFSQMVFYGMIHAHKKIPKKYGSFKSLTKKKLLKVKPKPVHLFPGPMKAARVDGINQ